MLLVHPVTALVRAIPGLLAVLFAARGNGQGEIWGLAGASLAVLAGVLWPVLVVGVVELIAIVVVARWIRAAGARQSGQAPMDRDEVLISSF